MNNDWLYFGIFFKGEEKQKLLNLAKKYVPDDWRIYCDHCTLAFNDGNYKSISTAEAVSQRLGEEISVCGFSIGISDNAIALRLSSAPTANEIPHITLGVKPGHYPVESNYITEWEELSSLVFLKGVIDVAKKKKA